MKIIIEKDGKDLEFDFSPSYELHEFYGLNNYFFQDKTIEFCDEARAMYEREDVTELDDLCYEKMRSDGTLFHYMVLCYEKFLTFNYGDNL